MPDMAALAMLDGEHEDETFTGIEGDNAVLDDASFFQCTFRNASFQYAAFNNCRFERCIFEGCNLSLAQLRTARLIGVKFKDSKLAGINWSNTSGVFSASFSGCVMDNCAFSSMNLSKYRFTNCSFRDASFMNTKLHHAVFEECDLRKCMFHNTDLSHADFSTSRDYFINADSNRFHKTVFSLPEAVSLLSNFDITLK